MIFSIAIGSEFYKILKIGIQHKFDLYKNSSEIQNGLGMYDLRIVRFRLEY